MKSHKSKIIITTWWFQGTPRWCLRFKSEWSSSFSNGGTTLQDLMMNHLTTCFQTTSCFKLQEICQRRVMRFVIAVELKFPLQFKNIKMKSWGCSKPRWIKLSPQRQRSQRPSLTLTSALSRYLWQQKWNQLKNLSLTRTQNFQNSTSRWLLLTIKVKSLMLI